jgi:putative N-acetylmannosamine-6-phosphate epimerase
MELGTMRLKVGLAEMLKGGVIMDVTNAEQAKIAEDAGAVAVMALERVPSDIRKDGGVARMSPVKKIKEIQQTVSIPYITPSLRDYPSIGMTMTPFVCKQSPLRGNGRYGNGALPRRRFLGHQS